MRSIGFSTGSLALGDFRRGLRMIEGKHGTAVELSALREDELVPLIDQLDQLDLRPFSYISFHAPSQLRKYEECSVVKELKKVAKRGWPIVVHPDVIQNRSLWADFRELLCIENMDKRKRMGRTAVELDQIFRVLPHASLCFDIGHARQIDPTMCEAAQILRMHGHRLREVHMSHVTSESTHQPLSYEAIMAFRKVAKLIPTTVAIILETPVTADALDAEIQRSHWALGAEGNDQDTASRELKLERRGVGLSLPFGGLAGTLGS